MSLTTEQVLELIERSKDDRAIIVGSEVRQLCDLALWALDEKVCFAEHNAMASGRDALIAKWNDERTDRYARQESAATILAALTRERMVPNTETDDEKATLDDLDRDCVRYSVALADALRAELGKTGGGGK